MRRTLAMGAMGAMAAAAVFGVVGSARAQEAPKEEPLGWMERMVLDQMSQRLGLTGEQRTKVEALMRESARRRKEMDEESAKRIRDLLTDDQKPKYDELREWGRRWGGRGGGWGGGGGPGGGGGGGGDPGQLRELTDKLGLTEEQQQKLREVGATVMEKGRKRGEEIWRKIQDGTMGFDEIPKEVEKFLDTFASEFKPVLNDEQKTKFDSWLKELKEQMSDPSQWGKLTQRFGGGGWGGGGGPGGPGAGGGGGWRGGDPDDPGFVDRVLSDLRLTEDERLVLQPAIRKIMEHDRAQRRAVRDRAPRLRAAASTGDADAAKAAIAEARKADADARGKREEMEGELRDLVTVAQEAVLVSHGVLR